MAVNKKNDEALVEIGKALFDDLGFYAASNSIKPLYVANGLFRETSGVTCDISDIYEWVRAENTKNLLHLSKFMMSTLRVLLLMKVRRLQLKNLRR